MFRKLVEEHHYVYPILSRSGRSFFTLLFTQCGGKVVKAVNSDLIAN